MRKLNEDLIKLIENVSAKPAPIRVLTNEEINKDCFMIERDKYAEMMIELKWEEEAIAQIYGAPEKNCDYNFGYIAGQIDLLSMLLKGNNRSK